MHGKGVDGRVLASVIDCGPGMCMILAAKSQTLRSMHWRPDRVCYLQNMVEETDESLSLGQVHSMAATIAQAAMDKLVPQAMAMRSDTRILKHHRSAVQT